MLDAPFSPVGVPLLRKKLNLFFNCAVLIEL